MSYFVVGFWRDSVERAIKSAAQGMILTFGASDAGPVDLFHLDFKVLLGAGAGMAVLSVLTSVASKPLGSDKESPSLA